MGTRSKASGKFSQAVFVAVILVNLHDISSAAMVAEVADRNASHNNGLTNDSGTQREGSGLAEALEKLTGQRIGAVTSTLRATAAEQRGSRADRAQSDVYDTLLRRVSDIAELIEAPRIADDEPPADAALRLQEEEQQQQPAPEEGNLSLAALLQKFGESERGRRLGGALYQEREYDRRMFTNGGGRGKKQEPDVTAESNGGLRSVLRELVDIVRVVIIRYRADKEENDETFSTLLKIAARLVSYYDS